MGKDSLIKSTSKKKDDKKKSSKKVAAKKATAAKTTKAKKSAAKTTKKSAAKAPAKSKAVKKTAAKPVKKATNAKPAPKKIKKLTVKELLLLKFKPMQPAAKAAPAAKPTVVAPSAPPVIASTDPKEVARMRAILSEKFSMEKISAAAKAPASQAIVEPAPASEPVVAPVLEDKTEVKAPTPEPTKESAYITTEPPQANASDDPVALAAKIGIVLAAAVVLLILSISYNNSTKYYITPKDNAIEIWKGRFSPKDNKFFMILHGTELTEPVKPVYASKEVFPLIFNYYLEKADTLLEVPGPPDYKGIKDYLQLAQDYTVSPAMDNDVNSRLNTIERNTLLYKADVALSKGTIESLQSGIKLLKQAGKLATGTVQADEINGKIVAAGESITALKAAAKEAEKQRLAEEKTD